MLTYHAILATLATLALLIIAAASLTNAIIVGCAGRRVIDVARRATAAVSSAQELVRRVAPGFEQIVTNAASNMPSDSPRWSDGRTGRTYTHRHHR